MTMLSSAKRTGRRTTIFTKIFSTSFSSVVQLFGWLVAYGADSL
jgi:hypothetical protein